MLRIAKGISAIAACQWVVVEGSQPWSGLRRRLGGGRSRARIAPEPSEGDPNPVGHAEAAEPDRGHLDYLLEVCIVPGNYRAAEPPPEVETSIRDFKRAFALREIQANTADSFGKGGALYKKLDSKGSTEAQYYFSSKIHREGQQKTMGALVHSVFGQLLKNSDGSPGDEAVPIREVGFLRNDQGVVVRFRGPKGFRKGGEVAYELFCEDPKKLAENVRDVAVTVRKGEYHSSEEPDEEPGLGAIQEPEAEPARVTVRTLRISKTSSGAWEVW